MTQELLTLLAQKFHRIFFATITRAFEAALVFGAIGSEIRLK